VKIDDEVRQSAYCFVKELKVRESA